MAMNRIQFQHGMSLPEFLRSLGTEIACAESVMAARWPNVSRAQAAAKANIA